MKHNSILQITGNKQNIFISQSQAEKINEIFANKEIPSDFVINLTNPNISFRKSAIRTIEINSDGDSHANNEESFKLFYEKEKKDNELVKKWTPEQKANRLDIFMGLYQFSTDELPNQSVLDKATEIQLSFFKENPNRTLCDMYLLKQLIPIRQKKLINPFHLGYFRLIERAIFRDMQLSGKFKNT